MYARSSTFHSDPARIDEGIAFVRDEVAPALEAVAGATGLSLIVHRDSGRLIATSGWEDMQTLRDGDDRMRPLRERGAEILAAAPVVDVWEIAVLHRVGETGRGACLRASWLRVDPARLERSVDNYRSTLLPMMEELPGFCSASLFVDRATGRSVSSVTYVDTAAMDTGREMAASMRRTAVAENDLQLLEVAEFEVERAHLRVPVTV